MVMASEREALFPQQDPDEFSVFQVSRLARHTDVRTTWVLTYWTFAQKRRPDPGMSGLKRACLKRPDLSFVRQMGTPDQIEGRHLPGTNMP
jgi:hypothetical protein